MSLLNPMNISNDFGGDEMMPFWGLFYNAVSLADASKLSLPSSTCVYGCYANMFYGCTSLVKGPELPAMSLAYECYMGMFYGCTSLKSAPALPVTALESECYASMFYGCTSLTASPYLPATTTYSFFCYYNMFKDCTSLSSVRTAQRSFDNCDDWLAGTSAAGKFYCPAALGT